MDLGLKGKVASGTGGGIGGTLQADGGTFQSI